MKKVLIASMLMSVPMVAFALSPQYDSPDGGQQPSQLQQADPDAQQMRLDRMDEMRNQVQPEESLEIQSYGQPEEHLQEEQSLEERGLPLRDSDYDRF